MRNPTIGILDCGSGNLRSVAKAIAREKGLPEVSRAVDHGWDGLVLPGVGAFGHTMKAIGAELEDILKFVSEGKPFLGICLGLQILFEYSDESPGQPGLSVMRGKVVKIIGRKVPHMGWNSLDITKRSSLLDDVHQGDFFYFVHSYAAMPDEDVTVATCEYEGRPLTAVVERGRVYACQFHPEKSGAVGLRIIGNFVRICAGG